MDKIGRVVWVDSEQVSGYGTVARVSLRMENGDRKDCYFHGVEPWGYVHENASLPERDWIIDVEHGYESLFNDPLKKVIVDDPEKVYSGRDDDVLVEYVDESFEADLPMYRKLAVVDGISGYVSIPDTPETKEGDIEVYDFANVVVDVEYSGEEITPRIMLSDIEVQVTEGVDFEEMQEKKEAAINVICSYDNYEETYTVFFYDKYANLDNPENIREIIREQWENDSEVDIEKYAEADIDLLSSPTEEDMLKSFLNYVNEKKFDITSGWNWVNFDYDYLLGRMKKINQSSEMEDLNRDRITPFGGVSSFVNNDRMKVPGLPAFDMMRAFCSKMTFTNWRSKSLDYVSNEELGVGKVDEVDIAESWENNPELLIGYNIVDVGLTVALDDANSIHSSFYDRADTSSIPIYDTFYEKRLVDGYIMSRRGSDEILPTADESELPDNAGGFVADPANGRHNNIGVVDLKSLYPSSIITWNISTETVSDSPEEFDDYVQIPKVPAPKDVSGSITEKNIEWDWLYASLDKEGLIPRTIKQMFKDRAYAKKQRDKHPPGSPEYNAWDREQASIKVIMNSFYGNASSKYWRLSNEFLGDATTSSARYTLWKGLDSLEGYGKESIYSDTDSHFFYVESEERDDMVQELEEVTGHMNNEMAEIASDIGIEGEHPYLTGNLHGDKRTCLWWEAEKIYDTWMQLGRKKRYAGSIFWKEGEWYDDPKISISGFEFRRSDSMEVTADLQQTVIEMILRGAEFEEVSEYIQSIISQIDVSHSNVKKFALPMSLGQALAEYANSERKRACEYSNEYLDLDFGKGDSPFVYKVRKTPSGLPNTDVVALKWNHEVPEGFKLDDEAIIDRGIKKPIDTIIGEMDWEFSEIRSGKQQQSMDLNNSGENPFA